MKSKLFGLNAKLALAVLAVGTMFTSCYDSENGDVTKPYTPENAVYTIVGTVSNDVTGAPVAGATVTLSGAISATTTTDSQGLYQVVKSCSGGVAGSVTVAVSATNDYNAAEETFNVEQIDNGQSVIYYKNIIVNYVAYLPDGLKVDVATNTTSATNQFQGEDSEGDNYVESLDLINNTDDAMYIIRDFNVWTGTRISDDPADIYNFTTTKGIVDDENAIADIKKYVRGNLGLVADPTNEFGVSKAQYSFTIAPLCALQSITVTYTYETKDFNFTYKNEAVKVTTQRVVSVTFSNSQVSVGHYHGHGHGHGDDANAGGGIIDPEL